MTSPINEAVKSYFIAFSVRSGSNFLCDCLAENGLGFPNEFFQYPHGVANRMWHDLLGVPTDDFQGYLRAITSQRSQNGWFGVKFSWDHMNALLASIRKAWTEETELHDLFPDAKWIHLDRRDKIGQAISLARAIQTGIWTSSDETRATEFEYDYYRFLSHFETILAEGYLWQLFFESKGLPVLRLTYEDFVARPRETVLEVRQFLDPSGPPPLIDDVRIPAQFQKQHDPRSAEFRKQFIGDLNHIGDIDYWRDRASQVRIWSDFFGQRRWLRQDNS